MTTADKSRVEQELAAARRRSLALLDPLSDDDQRRQHSPLMAPLAWDLGHVANYEEQWLVRAVGGAATAGRADLDDIYDAFRHPRRTRPALAFLGPTEARAYAAEVRDAAVDLLDRAELGPEVPLLDGAFVYGMVAQHEHQHDETMLATRQLMGIRATPPPGVAPAPSPTPVAVTEVQIPAGTYVLGTDLEPWAYDNERPAHRVDLASYWIDTTPVTCGRYLGFVESGGYRDRRWWSEEGWDWCQREEAGHPQFWRHEGGDSWSVLRFGRRIDLAANEPVQHVCWHEAEACARFLGRRLPTEAEWEVAASVGPDGVKRRFPWGDQPPGPATANLGQVCDGPAPVGAYPSGVSPWGCHQMVGDVWEWTSSDFEPYPGFRPFPYREYSEVFHANGYKVLRGGSWATAPVAVRATFRNWDHAIRRQIFSGFRCARDAG
ncbi:MAG: ergothioneine biosynthesis protein EgtB [Acidimicrobiales bacterium]